jgi:hypothetical protein
VNGEIRCVDKAIAMNTKAGPELKRVLNRQPFDRMYEEDKKAGVLNLNPLLRSKLNGVKKAYPALPGATCDVVFRVGGFLGIGGDVVWMEVKLMQTHNGGNRDDWLFEERNRSFAKYLGEAARDVRDRLPTLDGLSVADRIGFPMVTYHSPRHPIDEQIDRFEQNGGLHDWAKDVLIDQKDTRPRAKIEKARISVYYWERRTRRG